MTIERVLLFTSVYLVAFVNTSFWRQVLAERALDDWRTWAFIAATGIVLVCVHFCILAAIANRRTMRPLLLALAIAAALANHYIGRYGVILDAAMMRNVIQTDWREAGELITFDALAALIVGVMPLALLWKVRIRAHAPWRAIARRMTAASAAALAAACALLAVYQDASSLMRTHRDLRYTIVPASLLWSFGNVMASESRSAREARDPPEPIRHASAWSKRKPRLLVIVVGETARAANFSLNGYSRATTPELAQHELINFPNALACGTSTAVSLPCMFSPYGRADYDEDRIRRHESLLHVLSRAGFRVVWLDNQSGCKGVCAGLEYRNVVHAQAPGLCNEERCYDEILAYELARVTARSSGDLVVVLHGLGNHGPAYFRRYPEAFKRFAPVCEREELRDCSSEEIVNAYDNAIAYTDHVLSRVIQDLDRLQSKFDVAMVYASDHGESLGEKGLYLHGMPYAIAPQEQLRVPMFWWLPAGSAASAGIDVGCVRDHASEKVSHDNLYHSVMGLLDVETARYRSDRDLFAKCRTGSGAGMRAAVD